MSRKLGGKTRKYYSITRKKEKQLRARKKEWKEYAGAVEMFWEVYALDAGRNI